MRSIQAIKGVFRVNTIEDILKTQSFNINKGKVEGSSRKRKKFLPYPDYQRINHAEEDC